MVKKFNTNNLEISRANSTLKSLKAQASRQKQMVAAYDELKRVGASSELNLLDAIQTLNNLNQQISESKNKIDQIDSINFTSDGSMGQTDGLYAQAAQQDTALARQAKAILDIA